MQFAILFGQRSVLKKEKKSWALSECYSGGGGSKPQDESRSAPPDPRDDGFLQKIVDFLGRKIRGKWGRQSEEILHKLEMR